MPALNRLSLVELEELAAKLRHAIARNPEDCRAEQLELEDVKQWISIRKNSEEFSSEH